MPQNKRESLIYSVIMCFVMVFGMSVYNVALHNNGVSMEVIAQAWMGMPIAYTVAFILDMLVASKFAKGIAFRYLVSFDSPAWQKVLAISSLMVVCMCFFMSLYGALEVSFHSGDFSSIFKMWMTNIPLNFIAALPLQLIIAGPIVRKIFRAAFPVGVVQ